MNEDHMSAISDDYRPKGSGLTPEILATICPVARSDRRRHRDLFADFLSEEETKDDSCFYRALLGRIRADRAFLRRFDERFWLSDSEKENRKSFRMRASRWLHQRSGAEMSPKKIIDLDDDHFPAPSPERETLALYKTLMSASTDHDVSAPYVPPASERVDPGLWIAIRDRLRATLEALEAPDPDRAEAILAEAEALVSACANAARGEAQAELLNGLRANLTDRLSPLAAFADAQNLIELIDGAGSESLKKLEMELDGLVALHEAFVGARQAFVSELDAYEEALPTKDRRLIASLNAKVDEADDARRLAEDDLLKALRGALAPFDVESDVDSGSSAAKSDTLAERRPEVLVDKPQPPAQPAPDVAAKQLDTAPYEEPVASNKAGMEHAATMAEGHAAEPKEDTPPVWSGAQPLDQLLAEYLFAGEHALAFQLADLAEERGFAPALPAAVFKALVVSPAVAGPWDAAAQRMGEILADAMATVDSVEATGDERKSDLVRAVTFAALLRPALLTPDTTARQHLTNLSMRGSLGGYSPLHAALSGLGYDFQPSVGDLAKLAGTESRRRLPDVTAALRAWLEQARSAQSLHAPTHMILHQLLASNGGFGHAAEAALAGAAGAELTVRHLIQDLADDRAAQERLITNCEIEMGRPRRDRIRGMALEWACRKLQDGCERLDDWLEAFQTDGRLLDDSRRQAFQRQIGTVKKALIDIGTGGDREVSGLDGAVARVVHDAVQSLRQLIEGDEAVQLPRRLSDVQELPLLRLSGGCQPWTPRIEDQAYAKERSAQRMRLFSALQNAEGLGVDERAAFKAHCEERAILSARRLLDRLKDVGALSGKAAEEAEQALAETTKAARHRAQVGVEALRLELATLYNLDLGTGDAVRQWLDRLDAIAQALTRSTADMESGVLLPALDGQRAPDIPPDFPELDTILDEIRRFRDGLAARILEEQRARLNRLIEERPAQAKEARVLADTLESRDPVTVEDMIAQLQAGLPLSSPNVAEEDAFAAFFPGFVEAVAASSPNALNRGLIDAALREGSSLGPLEFSGLDADARKSAAQLLDRWRRTENAMKQAAGDQREALRQLMETVGFTSVSIAGDNQLIPGRLRRFQMRSDPLGAEHWFLPPVFGSEAGGAYPLFLALPEVQDDQLATQLGKAGRESPCLLLVFGKLSRQRRESFARRMRRDKQSVLLMDETHIIYLATSSADRMEKLFTCAAPFGYLQPYTTSAGNIPREMFFGRDEEIEKIVSRRSDGCLVYGGRQLGKSALLHHVRKLYDNPASGARAFYLKIDVIGAHGTPATQIWREIGSILTMEGIGEKERTSPDAVTARIRTWLDANPMRRLLMLLDETDAFLAAESRTGFPNLGRLKDLMEETGRRFKVVFAGLHNVRRIAQAPNSPLVHLGDPICIGPLNTSTESRSAARKLVTTPMRAAGFDYEDPELAWDILARVNHYPSLIQVFCKALLDGLSNQSRPVGEGPRWPLAREQIFEGSSAQEINRQIRERFQWTLNLDPRYELIANVLAIYRLEKSDGDAAVLRNGLLAEQISIETFSWWPSGIDRLGLDDFRAFLEEMVDLGVLARYGVRRDRFGLRSAQVAQMMGRHDEIVDQITRIHFKEPQVDYDAAQYHRRVTLNDPGRRSPLSDRALADLFDTRNPGLRIFVAAPALWGPDLAGRLRDLAHNWTDEKGRLSGLLHTGPISKLRGVLERGKGTRQIIVVGSEDAEEACDDKALQWLARQPAVQTGDIVPICLASLAWLSRYRHESTAELPLRIVTPRPWGEGMLRAWFDERDIGLLDVRPVREWLLAGTGGAPMLLEAVRPLLQQIAATSADPEKEIRAWAEAQVVSPEAAGLSVETAESFRELADLVQDKQEDISTVQELFTTGGHSVGLKLEGLLHLFVDLGLVRLGDPADSSVALTLLGRLVARATVRP